MLQLMKTNQQDVFLDIVTELQDVLNAAKNHFQIMKKVLAAKKASHKKRGTLKEYLAIRYSESPHDLRDLIRGLPPPVFLRTSQHVTFKELRSLKDPIAFAQDCVATLQGVAMDPWDLASALSWDGFSADWTDWKNSEKQGTFPFCENLNLVVTGVTVPEQEDFRAQIVHSADHSILERRGGLPEPQGSMIVASQGSADHATNLTLPGALTQEDLLLQSASRWKLAEILSVPCPVPFWEYLRKGIIMSNAWTSIPEFTHTDAVSVTFDAHNATSDVIVALRVGVDAGFNVCEELRFMYQP